MRKAVISTLAELADSHPEIYLLTGDLGYTVLEPFADRHPDRFINVGVAEQNMLGIAAGLAEAGFVPYVYSIATFAALRGYEFFRNGAILHNFRVRILGVGGGFDYGTAGPTHQALEDLGVMRIQPGLSVIAPNDVRQARAAIKNTWDADGPIYFRIGKDEKNTSAKFDGGFEMGRVDTSGSGGDICLLSTGSAALDLEKTAASLEEKGISCGFASVPTLAPAPTEKLADFLKGYAHAVTVEDHFAVGGLGSLVAEVIAENGLSCRLTRFGVTTSPRGPIGGVSYLRERHGLSADDIIRKIESILADKTS